MLLGGKALYRAALAAALSAGVALGLGADFARAASEIKVGMGGAAYAPKAIKAKVGDTIAFTNDDFTDHWVYVPTLGYQVSRAGLKQGETFKLVVAKPGSFDVGCAVHANMWATVTVER
ncbi:MAG: cupredoxin domain-containing protein [Proteobacteria bacterium]|nr:cupredoxin domain-containing protein [Pseudomonadota bacterium]